MLVGGSDFNGFASLGSQKKKELIQGRLTATLRDPNHFMGIDINDDSEKQVIAILSFFKLLWSPGVHLVHRDAFYRRDLITLEQSTKNVLIDPITNPFIH